MNKKLPFKLLCLCLLFSGLASAQQSVELLREDFNSGGTGFTIAPDSFPTFGSNRWALNNQYDGKGIYPTTTTENHTVSGTITFPDSNYLHIYDTLSAALVSNCNYNDTVASDNFVYLAAGICTKGFTDVHLTFFYLAQGNANDYATLYYRIDGGQWIQCGAAKYNNQIVWKQEDITLPDFEEHYSLQFGFRWQNAGAGGPNKISFGVDDIVATGVYKPTVPLQVSVTSISPDTVCAETFFKLGYNLSQPFCDGSYQVIISNSSGSFLTDTTNLGSFTIAQGDTAGVVTGVAPLLSGSCFKFRIDRVSPPPAIRGVPGTTCFTINNCPNTITTLQSSVTYGPDTLCDGSVMDVPFYSTGTFNGNNKYIAQLSDANGSFANPLQIGSSSDSTNYDPFQVFAPGNIAGVVPVTAPGCNYYIRVIATSPSTTPGTNGIYGPFCIRHCDVTTNNMMDVAVCITDTVGAVDTILVKTNSWNNNNHYAPGNKFIAQLIEPFNYFTINDMPLGVVTADSTTKLILRIPPYDSLYSKLFLFPNTYYLRVISTNSSSQSDTLGTIIRLTIGYSDSQAPLLTAYDVNFAPDSVFCSGDEISVLPDNWQLLSNYQWETSFPLTGLDNPFSFDPPLTIELSPLTPPGKYWFRSREVNNGCNSDWSDTLFVTVITKPNVLIASSSTCLEDTVSYSVPAQAGVHYAWTITGTPFDHHIIKNTGNAIEVVFDSTTTYTVTINATNQCGASVSSSTAIVSPRPVKPILNATVNGVKDSIISGADLLKVVIVNNNPSQAYQWETSLNIGVAQPFNYASPLPLRINSSNNSAGRYWFICREYVSGCLSDWSDTLWIYYDGTNGVSNVDAMEQVHLIPNPATDEVQIQTPQDAGVYELELTDLEGKLIKTQPVTGTNTKLNIETIPAGVYLVRLTGKGTKVFKLVKE